MHCLSFTKKLVDVFRRNSTPYISIAFCNRNDNYGGQQALRINKFIDYYAYFARRWPGLFEVVVCDWNPPADRPGLWESFDWKPLGDVSHYVVSAKIHEKIAGEKGWPMLDYIGRNVAARRGRGQFVMVLNQDIYCSSSILEWFARRKLSSAYFYRADRCDFDFSGCENVPPEQLEAAAISKVFAINRRHNSSDRPITVPTSADRLDRDGSAPEPRDRFHERDGIIYCRNSGPEVFRAYKKGKVPKVECFRRQYLHTNASGDFIVAPRKAFFDIHGMPETTEFYMHLDSYAIVQLHAAGYRQAIFASPHRVFHADHSRQDRADYQESISWPEHEDHLASMVLRDSSYCFNDEGWGLGDHQLMTPC